MRLPLEAVISKYHKSLFGAALGVLADFDEADDAVQETFIRYYNSDLEFNDESHLKAWLFRVVINCSRDSCKHDGHLAPFLQIWLSPLSRGFQ